MTLSNKCKRQESLETVGISSPCRFTYFGHAPFGIFDSNKVVLKLQIVGEFGKQVDAESRTAHHFFGSGSIVGVGKSASIITILIL